MDLGIKDRTALITGAVGGMGQAVAALLAQEGVRLVLTDTDADQLRKTAAEVGGEVDTHPADLSTPDGVKELARAIDPRIDILIHTAGITGAKGDPLDMTEDDWQETLQIDFLSAVRVARAFVPAMQTAGWGRVVFVTSENVAQPYPDEVVYNVAKAAVLTFSKSLSMTAAKHGVLVNCVAPAFIETDMTDGMMEKRADELGVSKEQAIQTFLDEQRPHLVLDRRGKPEEVAAVVALLASERASFVVGSNYRVDGGSVQSINI